MTLEDVADRTRIPIRYLRALEDGKSEHLPETVYVRAFIRKYGDLVELDGLALLEELKSPEEAQVEDKPASPSVQNVRLAVKPTLRPYHAWLLYGGLMALALGGFTYLQRQSTGDPTGASVSPGVSRPTPAPVSTVKTVVPATVAVRPATPRTAPPAILSSSVSDSGFSSSVQAATLSADTPLRLRIDFPATAWVRVTLDGKKAYEGVIPAGSKRDWQARDQMKIRTGNAGGVMLTYNDQSIGSMGKTGQIAEREFKR